MERVKQTTQSTYIMIVAVIFYYCCYLNYLNKTLVEGKVTVVRENGRFQMELKKKKKKKKEITTNSRTNQITSCFSHAFIYDTGGTCLFLLILDWYVCACVKIFFICLNSIQVSIYWFSPERREYLSAVCLRRTEEKVCTPMCTMKVAIIIDEYKKN